MHGGWECSFAYSLKGLIRESYTAKYNNSACNTRCGWFMGRLCDIKSLADNAMKVTLKRIQIGLNALTQFNAVHVGDSRIYICFTQFVLYFQFKRDVHNDVWSRGNIVELYLICPLTLTNRMIQNIATIV